MLGTSAKTIGLCMVPIKLKFIKEMRSHEYFGVNTKFHRYNGPAGITKPLSLNSLYLISFCAMFTTREANIGKYNSLFSPKLQINSKWPVIKAIIGVVLFGV